MEVAIRDVLVERNDGAILSGYAGCPVYQAYPFAVMAERILGAYQSPDDTGFFQRHWKQLNGRDEKYRNLMRDIVMNGILYGIEGHRLARKFEVRNGRHRVAIAYALGMKTIPVAEEMPLDPLDKPGLALTLIHNAYRQLILHGKRELDPESYSYNALRGRKSTRASIDRLRLIYENIITARGRTLLDLGCADGYFGVSLCYRAFEPTFVDRDPFWLDIVKAKLTVLDEDYPLIGKDAVEYSKDMPHFAVVICIDVFDQIIRKHGLDESVQFLLRLIEHSEDFTIFSPGKWPRVVGHGFDQRKMLEVIRLSGKRLRYIGRDNDDREAYGRELYCIY